VGKFVGKNSGVATFLSLELSAKPPLIPCPFQLLLLGEPPDFGKKLAKS